MVVMMAAVMRTMVRTVMSNFPFAAVEFFALAVLTALKLAVFSVYAGMDLVTGSAFASHAVAQAFHAAVEFTSVVALSSFKMLFSVVMIGQQLGAGILSRYAALIYDIGVGTLFRYTRTAC